MTPTQLGTIWLLGAIITDVVSTIYMAKAEGFENLTAFFIGALLYAGSFIACVIALKYGHWSHRNQSRASIVRYTFCQTHKSYR